MSHRTFGLLLLSFAVSACDRPGDIPPPPPVAKAPTESPAEMSHGEAKVNDPAAQAARSADAPQRSGQRMHRVRMTTTHAPHVLSPTVTYNAWTFENQTPGPVVRVTVGDTVDFTIVNAAPIPHSMDFHAAEIAPSRAYVNVNPGDSLTFRFVARVPGAFMYHCGTAPVAAHIANGMYGALIVDPATPLPPAREFVVVQSEFYLGDAAVDGRYSLDWPQLLDLSPDHVVFNGIPGQYAAHPLQVEVGERVRFYVVNAGPNRVSAFHVVGAIFDRVRVGGFGAPLEGVQTFNVPVGGGAVFETHLAEEGLYPFVSHAFSDATKGAVGIVRAGNPSGTAAH